jgi:hypothetical protein
MLKWEGFMGGEAAVDGMEASVWDEVAEGVGEDVE